MVEFVKRHAWWLIGPIVVCAMVGVWIAIQPPPRQFTQEQSAQLRLGMTEPEVYKIMGCPAGIYGAHFEFHDPFPDLSYRPVESIPGHWDYRQVSIHRWYSPNGCIEVCVDNESGLVIGKRWARWERPEKPSWYMSIAANLRRFAGKLGL
jgi:hypothetical protein